MDPDDFAKLYFKRYGKYIFHQEEYVIEPLCGEDVEEVVKALKETAGGLDQCGPTDLKLLSSVACSRLADLFNLIEGGCS